LIQSKIIVIESNKLERNAGGKPVPTFPHPALGATLGSSPAGPVGSEEGMMGISNRACRFASVVLISMGLGGTASAADYGHPPPPADYVGIACDVGDAGWHMLMPAYWSSLWLGHFSGGVSHYDRDLGVVALAWGDEKRCFPSMQACSAWVASMRRDFHRPAGYWTCLLLR
jgi:hypothetical protein